ncbi:MAG: M20/M25/M40 family metallo-hydrolase [Nitrospirota bacterium]
MSLKSVMLFYICGILCILTTIPASIEATELPRHDRIIHHNLKVVLYPKEQRFSVEDTVTVSESHLPEFNFSLHGGLNPLSPTQGVSIVHKTRKPGAIPLESFKVKLPPGLSTFVLKYGGSIYHPIEPYGKEQARGFSHTPGVISEDGVYLARSSFWYPVFDEGLVTFNLQVELPPEWDAVSQGERTLHIQDKNKTRVRWESPEPQDEIFIIASRFAEYTKPSGRVTAIVFLRTPDEKLAGKYLDTTVRYLAMYEKLVGPYPYKKFALVENFWETGLGMPSFTLLGPKVIRFPFIINSSYPHEILHNWWGDSVFPDYMKGNWSEGLTAYLSDHLIKEQQGNAVEYRQATLQKYADYVLSGRDFPLTEFHSRYSSSSEAVGYGKSLMFFHMLRQYLGDKTFKAGIQEFYRKNKFRVASFNDLKKSFEEVSGKDMGIEFEQWITQPGAPKIKLSNARARAEGGSYVLTAIIEQMQTEKAYLLRIPIAVTMEGQKQAYQTVVVMNKKRLEFELELPSQPLRLDVDPEFDIFRRLDRDEIPPALSQALGAEKMLVLLPSSATKTLLQAYQEFAKALSNSGPDTVEMKLDNEVKKLPSDCAITVLGWENRFLKETVSALSVYDVTVNQKSLRIGKIEILRENHSVVLTARNPENKDMALMLIASEIAEALPGLSRKLPHYHKYSYLGFQGNEPANIAKGRWPVINSPMTAFMPCEDGLFSRVEMGELAPREPITTLQPIFSAERMMETIRFLSSDELKGRGFGTAELDRAAEFIAQKFLEAGLKPSGDAEGSYFQTWKDPEHKVILKNVIGVIPAQKPERAKQSIVVGAHYDHLGLGWPDARKENMGKIHHGSDDNASGVSVLIELAVVLAKSLNPDRSVVFVAFTGEEAGKRGSKHYIANSVRVDSDQKSYPAEKCIGMLNIDTVGRLGKKKLLVLGSNSAKEWVHIFRGASFVTGVDVETVSEQLDSSDQITFQEAGVPAVQLFSGPHLDYHRPTDTVDKIDPDGLVKVASVAKEVIEYLAGRGEPLTLTVKPIGNAESATKKERKVSIGTIPDFSFSGIGCRLSGVMPNSPAKTCGLKEGDVIIRINLTSIHNLKDLSDTLKSLIPGSKISITFLRDRKEMTVEVELVAR